MIYQMKFKGIIVLLVSCLSSLNIIGQGYFDGFVFNKSDSLRGSLRLERTCFDVKHYALDITIDILSKTISGVNKIQFEYNEVSDQIQIDLFENMYIDSITYNHNRLNFYRDFNAVFVDIPDLPLNEIYSIDVYYGGKPIIAKTPPWDGGFVWDVDQNGAPFIGVACEGIGASLWWPNKDHLSDEPDSMDIKITVPNGLFAASNGNLISQSKTETTSSYHWHVSYPINNYNVSVTIADYAHFDDIYVSGEDTLALDYYVLKDNLEKAKVHFKQVPQTLEAFEFYFGKYPFWDDGFALIETPYLGMEHQSGIAYGNNYKKGYNGFAPKGMPFDYIIVHETGHEYFGNSVSCADHCDMWIHEAFTTYMEALFVEYTYGPEMVYPYLKTQKQHANHYPIIGPRGVNFGEWGDSDMYYKGTWILHTLRKSLNNDKKWFALLKDFYTHFAHSICDADQVISYFDEYINTHFETAINVKAYFDQYLNHPKIPNLIYSYKSVGKDLQFSMKLVCENKSLSLPISIGNENEVFRTVDVNARDWITFRIEGLSSKSYKIHTKEQLIEVELLN